LKLTISFFFAGANLILDSLLFSEYLYRACCDISNCIEEQNFWTTFMKIYGY